MDLFLFFQPPPCSDNDHVQPLPERHILNLPASLAERIAEDFRAYDEAPDEADSHRLYQYCTNGNGSAQTTERLLAIDFSEIVRLKMSPAAPPPRGRVEDQQLAH